MDYAAGLSFQTPTYNRKLARLKSGPLLKEILDRFNAKSHHKLKPNRSLWMYSAHDTTVANLLNTLKLFSIHTPVYASTILLEMRMYNNQPLISVYYKTTSEDPAPMEIPGCGIQCPLTKMYELYKDVIPQDWQAECNIQDIHESFLTSEHGIRAISHVGFTVGVVLIILALIILVLIIHCKAKHRRRHPYLQIY